MLKSRFEEVLAAASLSLKNKTIPEIAGEDPIFSTKFPVGEVAATALGLTGSMADHIWFRRSGDHQEVKVNVRDAAATLLGFGLQKLPAQKFALRSIPTIALYETADGRWIHLHGGLPHLAQGLLDILQCLDNRRSIKLAVKKWDGEELERLIAERGLCGILVRSKEEWESHPQGKALKNLPVVKLSRIEDAEPKIPIPGNSPLEGIRVLDLTRILAGPSCGRTLASYGADVIRISSPQLPSIEQFVIETGIGKKSASIDLETKEGVDCLKMLIKDADVFVNGYRTGSLEARGFGPKELAQINPGIIYVSINCYGPIGPWVTRKGWEQLAQSVTGIAFEQRTMNGKPELIQAAATDYTTGYLAAYGAMAAIANRMEEGGSWHIQASLCQTGMWLTRLGATMDQTKASGMGNIDEIMNEVNTSWGPLTHIKPVVQLFKTPAKWNKPPVPLGFHEPKW